MKSKVAFLIMIAGLALLLIAGRASAGIQGSRHDFSTTGASNLSGWYYTTDGVVDQVCIFCHTPHGASSGAAAETNMTNQFLWNRINSIATVSTSYKVYSNPSWTNGIVIDNPPKGITLMCMSCHDGVTTMQNILHGPGGLSISTAAPDSAMIGGLDNPLWTGAPVQYAFSFIDPNIGGLGPVGVNNASGVADLSNDHPVSFSWVDIPGELNTMASVKASPLKLYGPNNRLECATCHDVHDDTIPPFLRMSNDNSAMCLTCHIK